MHTIRAVRNVATVENLYHSSDPDMFVYGASVTMVRYTTRGGMIVDHICIMDLESQYESNVYIQVYNGYNLFIYSETDIGGYVTEYHADTIPADILGTYYEIHEGILSKIG